MYSTPSGDQLLEQDERRRIYNYVRTNPGIHLRKMQRNLEAALGTLEYHLYRLERAGLVTVRRLGRFKAFYAEGHVDRRDKDLLYFLRQQMPRHIALAVATEPGISFQSLAAEVPISPSTLSFHLKKLVKGGILVEGRLGREKTYECPEAERLRRLVIDYRATFVDDIVDRFADAWLSLDAGRPALGGATTGIDGPERGGLPALAI